MTVQCTACKGTKTIELTIYEAGTKSVMRITCVTCNGLGTISAAAAKEMEEFWCRCPNLNYETDDVRYFEDGEHPQCEKHHYRHMTCGRVVQVG